MMTEAQEWKKFYLGSLAANPDDPSYAFSCIGDLKSSPKYEKRKFDGVPVRRPYHYSDNLFQQDGGLYVFADGSAVLIRFGAGWFDQGDDAIPTKSQLPADPPVFAGLSSLYVDCG
jgi:hypothetical protein